MFKLFSQIDYSLMLVINPFNSTIVAYEDHHNGLVSRYLLNEDILVHTDMFDTVSVIVKRLAEDDLCLVF